MMTPTDWLVGLHDLGISFLRDTSYRVLHVVPPAWLRDATLRVVANLDHRSEARGPVFVIDATDGDGAFGWRERAKQLRELAAAVDGWNHEVLSEPLEPEKGGLLVFAEQLAELVNGRNREDAEIIVALAPAPIRARESWEQAIALLLSSRLLQAVRWILVDVDARSATCRSLPERAVLSHGVSRGVRLGAALGPPLGPRRARHGGSGAGPAGVVPPPRAGRVQPTVATERDETAQAVALHVLAASSAMDDQRIGEAVEHQCRARDLTVDDQCVDQTVVMELVLAGHLLAASAATQAIMSCERAVALAKEAQLHEMTAIALLTLGSCRMVRGDRPGALVVFAEGAACADELPSVQLAIEACRLTGEVALELGMEGQAVSFWARAIKRAKEDPSSASQRSGSAARCAQLLDRLCKERGVDPPAVQDVRLPGVMGTHSGPIQGTGTERLRGWTPEESQSLRQSWRAVLDEDTTSLLSSDELASIHGWQDLPPPRRMVFKTEMLLSSPSAKLDRTELARGRTEPLDPDELAAIRRRLRCDPDDPPTA